MKTKSILCGLLVCVGVLAIGLGTAPAQSFYSGNFLSGSNLLILAPSTNSYGATNLVYQKYGSAYGPGYNQGYTGAWTTNANGSLVPTVTNTFSTAAQYSTNSGAIQDVALWANRDGTFPNANVSVHLVGLNAIATNTLYFNFAGVPRALGGAVSTSSQNAWSFAVNANGTTEVCLATNIPTGAFQGCAGLRLVSVVSTNLGAQPGTNVWLKSCAINGYRP